MNDGEFSGGLIDFVRRHSGEGFAPHWYHNAEGDCIEAYWGQGIILCC